MPSLTFPLNPAVFHVKEDIPLILEQLQLLR